LTKLILPKPIFAINNKFKFMDNKQSFIPVTALDFPLLTWFPLPKSIRISADQTKNRFKYL